MVAVVVPIRKTIMVAVVVPIRKAIVVAIVVHIRKTIVVAAVGLGGVVHNVRSFRFRNRGRRSLVLDFCGIVLSTFLLGVFHIGRVLNERTIGQGHERHEGLAPVGYQRHHGFASGFAATDA